MIKMSDRAKQEVQLFADIRNMDAHIGGCTWWDLEVLAFDILSNCALPSLLVLAAVDGHCQKLVLRYLQRRVFSIVRPFVEGKGV